MNPMIKTNPLSGRWALPVVLVLMFVLSVTPATAQVSIEPGVKLGGNLATFQGDDAEATLIGMDGEADLNRRTGLVVGGFLFMDFAGPFALQPELLYVQKGAKMEGSATTMLGPIDFSATYKVDYLEIPVLAKFEVPMTGPASPNLFAGPALGFKMSESWEMEVMGETETEDSDDIKSTDLGFVIGAGMDFGLTAGTLTVDLRYVLGLSSLPSEGDDEADIKNGGIMLTAGFRF